MKNLLLITILFLSFALVHAQDIWVQKADFGGSARFSAVGFNIGNKGYIGTGYDSTGYTKDFWEYDPSIDTWTQKADFAGAARAYAVGFSIGNYGYIGTGTEIGGDNTYDLWQYDPISNSWMEKANFPGVARFWAVGFSIGNKGYIGTGWNQHSNNFRKDFWEYDPANDTWTNKADFGGPARIQAVGFSINHKGYLGTGSAEGPGVTNDFWEYDPATNQWTKKANMGDRLAGAVGFAIGNKGYISTGSDTNNHYTRHLWEYDTLANTWTKKASFAGTRRIAAVGFAIGNRGYIGTGDDDRIFPQGATKDFWQYTPDCTPPANLSTTSITSSTATLQWDTVEGAVKYKLRYRVAGSNASTTIYPVSNSKTISGLSPGTHYTWQVKSICSVSPDNSSPWSVKKSFTTQLRLGEYQPAVTAEVYPNPFSSSAAISFSLQQNSNTTIELLDLTGKKIKTLLDENLDAGNHTLPIIRENLSAGIYLVTVKINEQSSTLKVSIE